MLKKLKKKLETHKKDKSSKKMSPLEAYTYLLCSRLEAGHNLPTLDVNEGCVKMCYDKVVTSRGVHSFYRIVGITSEIPTPLLTFIRNLERKCNNTVKTTEDDSWLSSIIQINFHLRLEPYHINWNSDLMKRRRYHWNKQLKENEERFSKETLSKLSDYNEESEDKWLKESWQYFMEISGRNRATPLLETIVELTVPATDYKALQTLAHMENVFCQAMSSKGFQVQKVRQHLWDFIQAFSPVSCTFPENIVKKHKFMCTDELMSNMVEYSSGKIRGNEVLLGVDIETGSFVARDFVSKRGGAENILIGAMTGGGKSYFMKCLVYNFLINGYTVVVMDRDGEYREMSKSLGGIVISMAVNEGIYFDSTEIANLTGDEDVDSGLAIESRLTTESIFSILTHGEGQLTDNERKFFTDGYNLLYKQYGISMTNRSTWHKSHNLSYHKLFEAIKALRETKLYKEQFNFKSPQYRKGYYEEYCNFIDKLHHWFSSDGLYSYAFRKRISIPSVLKVIDGGCPMVVLHMDLKDEDSSSMDTLTLLKLFITSYLSSVILTHNKSRKKFTVDIIEEYQRYLSNSKARGMILSKTTGNRKKNAITGIITNNLGELAREFADPQTEGVRDNITTFCLGDVAESLVPRICETFNLNNHRDYYKLIAGETPGYENTFMTVVNRRESAIVKAIPPSGYESSTIFKSRDENKGKKEKFTSYDDFLDYQENSQKEPLRESDIQFNLEE